jgi:hypothetical protein
MTRRSWWIAVLAALILAGGGGLYVASRSAAARHWALAQVETRLSAALGRPAHIEAVTIRLWSGGLDLLGVRVTGDGSPPGGTLFAADRVEVHWSWSALPRRRIVLRSLSMTHPRLTLAATGPSAVRLEDSLPLLLQSQPVAIGGWPLLVRLATIQGGQVQWVEGAEVRGALEGLQGELTWRGLLQGTRTLAGDVRAARWRTALWGRPQELEAIRARLQGTGNALALSAAEFRMAGAVVKASGSLLDAAGNPRMDLRLDVQAPLQALVDALRSERKLEGSLAVAGRLRGGWEQVTFQGEGALQLLGQTGPATPLQFGLRWSDGRLLAETAGRAAEAGGSYQASLTVQPATGSYAAELRTTQADLTHLTGLPATLTALIGFHLPAGVSGRLTTDLDLTGQGTDLTTLRGHATIRVDDLRIPGETAGGGLQAQIAATRDRLTVQALTLDLPGAQIQGQGEWNFRTGQLNLPLQADLRNVGAFGRGFGLPALGGRATFQGRLLGTRDAPRLQGQLTWREARIATQRLDAVSGDIQLAGRALRTPHLTVRIGRTVATVRGSILARGTTPLRRLDVKRDLVLDLTGQLNPARTADLGALLPPDLQVEGAFRASGRLTGPLSALSGDMDIALGNFRTWEESWQRGSARLRIRQGAVDVTRLILRRGQEQLTGEIRLGADGSLQGELASTPMDLARSGTLARSDVTGRARFRLQFQGTLRDTRTLGQAEVSALIFRGTPFGPGSATFTLDHKVVTLDLTVQKGAERLQAVFSPPPNRTIRATLLLQGAELAPVLRLADIQIAPSWQPRGSGRIVFQGPAKDLAASQGTMSLDRLRLRFGEDLWESRGPVQATFSRQVVTFQPLHLSAGSAEVEIHGRAGEGNATDLAVAGQVPLVLLGQWLPVARATAGIADVNLRLRGALSAPEVQGSVRIQGGRVSLLRLPQEFQDVRTTLTLQNGRTQIQNWTARLAGGTFSASGEVWHEGGHWGLELAFQESGGRAEQLLAGLTGGTGEVTGDVSLGGSLTSLGASGEEFWRNLDGALTLRMKDGRIGRYTFLARLLSLLNVAQFLQLKSPDLFGESMPYQTLTADFTIRQGIARTEDLLLDSRAMKVNAVGTIDLPEQTADLTVAIKPFQTVDTIVTTIPLAGWILGGKEKSLLVAYYKVHGPLKDPQVTPVPLKSVGRNLFGIFRNLLGIPEALSSAFEGLPPQQVKPEQGQQR